MEDFNSDKGCEKLFKILQHADMNSYIMTGSVLKSAHWNIKNKPSGYLKEVGLKNCHSYTIIDVREVILENGDIEYLLFIRNPTGNIFLKKDEVWKGDWSPLSTMWTGRTRKQLNYTITEDDIKQAKLDMKAANEAFKLGKVDKTKKKSGSLKKSSMAVSALEGGEIEL